MSKPTQGQSYTIVEGDTLWSIASRAYGNPMKWSKIYRANSTTLKSKNADLIYPGEVIFIPLEEEIAAAKTEAQINRFASRSKGTFNLVIGGREVPVDTGRFQRGVDLLAFSWNATIPWLPGKDPELDKIIRRYSYAPSELYLGSELVATGKFYQKKPKLSKDSSTAELEFFSTTADLVDSTMAPPYEFGGETLKQIAQSVAAGYIVVFETSTGPAFDSATATKTETIGKFLQRLAVQRGNLCSTDERGRIVFMKANTSGKPICSFEEGRPPLEEFEATFDGRARYAVYRAVGQSGDGNDIVSTSKDPSVPGTRMLTFTADDVDAGTVRNAAEWRRAKSLADALTIPIPVPDWYAPDGSLWKPNTLVTLKSPMLDLPDPTALVIRTVDFSFSKSSRNTTLSVCPPFALAGGEIPKEWL